MQATAHQVSKQFGRKHHHENPLADRAASQATEKSLRRRFRWVRLRQPRPCGHLARKLHRERSATADPCELFSIPNRETNKREFLLVKKRLRCCHPAKMQRL